MPALVPVPVLVPVAAVPPLVAGVVPEVEADGVAVLDIEPEVPLAPAVPLAPVTLPDVADGAVAEPVAVLAGAVLVVEDAPVLPEVEEPLLLVAGAAGVVCTDGVVNGPTVAAPLAEPSPEADPETVPVLLVLVLVPVVELSVAHADETASAHANGKIQVFFISTPLLVLNGPGA